MAAPPQPLVARRLPVGAEVTPHGTSFRVWAPAARSVVVRYTPALHAKERDSILVAEPDGYFSALIPDAGAGTRYRFVLDGGDALPDPASRFQPDGPHGASQVVDPASFPWTDGEWQGVRLPGQVLYELHIGTFTRAGTMRAAIERLDHLAELGVTVIEVMPVAEFPGRFGWGYDGVALFAPTRLYGTPDDFRALVDAAHRRGLGVILDVVYNHLGPDGNYLPRFSPHYFSSRATEWGEALNFDGEHAGPVRELFRSNAAYWVEEFHLDGLRLDATQQIFDESDTHIVAEVRAAVSRAARGRDTIVIAENERQDSRMLRSRAAGGCSLDGMWNDDFHHSARVALTGFNEAYYSGYRGSAQELLSAVKYGFLYQGQYYAWQKARRGHPSLAVARHRYVSFLENHDQVSNSATGARLGKLTSASRLRALTALLLLGPHTPMLFQGQEFGATTPFLYFADHHGSLGELVRFGRASFLSQFPTVVAMGGESAIADPRDPATFVRCVLDWRERERHVHVLRLHHDLLRLRRTDPVLRDHAVGTLDRLDGALLDGDAFVTRFFGRSPQDDRLLVINLGGAREVNPMAEPLAAPPEATRWRVEWSSDDPRYGGTGARDIDVDDGSWSLTPESAVLLVPGDGTATSR